MVAFYYKMHHPKTIWNKSLADRQVSKPIIVQSLFVFRSYGHPQKIQYEILPHRCLFWKLGKSKQLVKAKKGEINHLKL